MKPVQCNRIFLCFTLCQSMNAARKLILCGQRLILANIYPVSMIFVLSGFWRSNYYCISNFFYNKEYDNNKKRKVLLEAVHGSSCPTDVLNTWGVTSFDKEMNFNKIFPTLSNPFCFSTTTQPKYTDFKNSTDIYAWMSFDFLKKPDLTPLKM